MKLHRNGFTLVELLASTAMCSVLAGLALPVLQQSREDARLIECANKMATIAAGSAMYEDANGRMPPLSTHTGPIHSLAVGDFSHHQYTGAISYVLPFIGENELFELMPKIATQAGQTLEDNNDIPSSTALLVDPGMMAAYRSKPPILICPSNLDYSTASIDRLFYAAIPVNSENNFYQFFFTVPMSTEFGRTSYIPSHGGFFLPQNIPDRRVDLSYLDVVGAMRNRLTSIAASELGDGSSNTILWGEGLGEIQRAEGNNGPLLKGANFSLFSMALTTGTRWILSGDASELVLFGSAEASAPFLIGSMHPDGSNVAMADGSIRFIDRETGRGVMTALGCGNDGWMVPRKK